jgi:hypothetical protein
MTETAQITLHIAEASCRGERRSYPYSRIVPLRSGGSPGHCHGFDRYSHTLVINDYGLKIPRGIEAVVKFIDPVPMENILPGMCFTSQTGAAALIGIKPDSLRHLMVKRAPLPSISLADGRETGRRVTAYALADLAPWLRANMAKLRPIDLTDNYLAPLLRARFS